MIQGPRVDPELNLSKCLPYVGVDFSRFLPPFKNMPVGGLAMINCPVWEYIQGLFRLLAGVPPWITMTLTRKEIN